MRQNLILVLCTLASRSSFGLVEDMCGPYMDIPCSLYGCGAPDEEGNAGQLPCYKYYPRDCQFTFKSTFLDYEQRVVDRNITKFTFPSSSSLTESYQLNSYLTEPIVHTWTGMEVAACNVTEVSYVSCQQDLLWRNYNCTLETMAVDLNLTASALEEKDLSLPLSHLFSIYGDIGGKEISLNPISNLEAVSVYSALRDTATVLNLTCIFPNSVVIDSCIMFEAEPTNESPDLRLQDPIDLNVLYRFFNPPVPALELKNVTDGLASEDMVMNAGNPIVTLDGVLPGFCAGFKMEYQGEDGTWYSYFLGNDGHYYDTSYITYVNGWAMYSAIIQVPWDLLDTTIAGRNLRMFVECLTDLGISLGRGYLYFGTPYAPWYGETITCAGVNADPIFCQ